MSISRVLKAGIGLLALAFVAGCEENGTLPRSSRHYVPVPGSLISLMAEKGTTKQQPILVRSYKQESELEIWKQKLNGEYVLLKTYPMCRWSGQLGPKRREGDRQVPEGFYNISQSQLNPYSSYYLSFNVGYPNAYDRAHGGTGSSIMVHGACSSMGCFSMTDEQIAEIYALAREAFGGGQKSIQLQSYPFRFTPENMAKYRSDPNMPFWKMLKEGSDSFEVTKRETQVAVCSGKYVFNRTKQDQGETCAPAPGAEAIIQAVAEKSRNDNAQALALVQSGAPAMRRIYKDGDQHPVFRGTQYAETDVEGRTRVSRPSSATRLAEVSRPEALEHGPVDVPIDGGKAGKQKNATQIATGLNVPAAAPAAGAVQVLAAKNDAAAKSSQAAAKAGIPANVVAEPTAPVATAEPAEKPLMSRLLSFGSQPAEVKDPIAVTEPAQASPAKVPVPPRAPARQAGAVAPDKLVDASNLVKRPPQTGILAGFNAMIGSGD